MFVGIDWASRAHELCVVDDQGAVVERFGFAHSERGISGALKRIAKLAEPGELPVAIERPDGLLVDRLLQEGHEVVPIHANAFHAARPRWEGAGSKSDIGDAYRLADLLRTDRHRLRALRPLDQATRELQALVRLRDDHVRARVAATNQLEALLAQHWPGAAAIFARLDSEIALAFLERYPTPQATTRLGEARLEAFLRRHSYCGRRSGDELLVRLREPPQPVHALDPELVAELVLAQARLVRTLLQTIADLDRAIAATVDQHAKAQILRPLPRVGTINLSQPVAELGPLLDRTESADQAAALRGACPITKRSGQQRAVSFRYATNTKARKALMLYADNSRHASPRAKRIYRDARARGCRHAHAVPILARAWLRVIHARSHTNTPHDPTRRRGHEPHLALPTLTHHWTYAHRTPGRPPLKPSLRELILRVADENPHWGYKRIVGELKGLGITVSATSVRKVLLEAGLHPAPQRSRSSWRAFIRAQAASMLACDLSVEDARVKRAVLALRRVLVDGSLSCRRVGVLSFLPRGAQTYLGARRIGSGDVMVDGVAPRGGGRSFF